MLKRILVSSTLAALVSSSLSAGDMRISGFATVAAGMNDSDTSTYMGYDDSLSFRPDSVLGLQFNANMTDNMGAVAQVVARSTDIGQEVTLEWGYISYDFNDEVRMLAGRIRPAIFLYSNYLDVGYAYLWVRTPFEMYAQVPITNIDGANLAYTTAVGDDYEVSINGWYGNSIKPVDSAVGSFDMEFDATMGVELALSNDYFKVRAGYNQTDISALLPNADANMNPELKIDKSLGQFYSLGFNMDYADVLVVSEYVMREIDKTVMPDITSYYATLGYRMGDFTPHVTYATVETDIPMLNTGNPGFDGPTNGALQMSYNDSNTVTLGLRYELNAFSALKVEYAMSDRTTKQMGDTGLTMINEDINTYKIALSAIF
ncbi:MAG: hypothetical protein U9P71_02310 [Campylobacterota bacterium]|nr:hypothetical protein [Campylobacterota bacterium]